MKSARVVGAGLSGLAAAACLLDRGLQVEVIEASSAPGGLIGTRHTQHGLVERAANAFVWTETTARWFTRLGISPEFPLPSARSRYIYRDGRPRRWPLHAGETAAMAACLARAYVTRGFHPRNAESVADFTTRVAGRAAARWLAGPAMQGIYATTADRISAAAIFGRRRRGRGRSASPPGGMGEFIGRLYTDLCRRGAVFSFGTHLRALDPTIPTVVCTNAAAAAILVKPHAPHVGARLERIEMTGVESVTAFYEPHAADDSGFGVLFPRGTGVQALGVLFNASIFRGRSRLRSETWIYPASTEVAASPAEDRVASDRRALTGRHGQPLSLHAARWPAALPVYDDAVLEAGRAAAELPAWLTLSGNYLGQIGVSALLARAEDTAALLASNA